MPPSTARNLISLFRSATRLTSERCITTAAKKKPNHNSILHDEMDLAWDDEHRHDTRNTIGGVVNMPLLERMSYNSTSECRKELTRDKKHKLVLNKARTRRFGRMFNACAELLGLDTAVEVFGTLGLETGLKDTTDEAVSLLLEHMAYQNLQTGKGKEVLRSRKICMDSF